MKATPSTAYSNAKAGLHALTQHLAIGLRDQHINVNAVSPAVFVSFVDPIKVEEALTSGFNAFSPIGSPTRANPACRRHAILMKCDAKSGTLRTAT